MVWGMKKTILAIAACLIACSLAAPAQAQPVPLHGVAPLAGDVVRSFDPPDQPWLAGHRGVDIEGAAGQTVQSALDGVVSFVGAVAGRPVVTIRRGGLAATYEPVAASVAVGQPVVAGQAIGSLLAGHPGCPGEACLHWGLKDQETYLNPLDLLGQSPVRLISAADLAAVRDRGAAMASLGLDGRVSAAGLVNPAAGPVSSAYGMRLHPVDGSWRFHDGLDIAAACGSPIVAAAAGSVTEVSVSGGYGNRLVIDHGRIGSSTVSTAYNHAQGWAVSVGQSVSQGQLLGWVGSTGVSTGCHLHFQAWLDGTLTDPQPLLP